jgi:predicted transcriptional regulator
LIIPCEVAVKSVVPAVRALMAHELLERHDLNQGQVAEILGISQSAVSKYSNKVRGYIVEIDNVENVHPLIDDMITMLMSREYARAELVNLFCKVCKVVRKTGLVCQFCKKAEPSLKIEECSFCLEVKFQKSKE